jgi:hypothetical protein
MWLHNQLLFLMISPCLDNMCHHNCILNLPRTFTHLARSTKCSLTTPNHPSHNYKIIQKLKNITLQVRRWTDMWFALRLWIEGKWQQAMYQIIKWTQMAVEQVNAMGFIPIHIMKVLKNRSLKRLKSCE